MKIYQRHPFHLISPSPYPLISSFFVFMLALSLVLTMHDHQWKCNVYIEVSLFLLVFSMELWWLDIIKESTYAGYHTLKVQKGLRNGMILFILSEVMFFFGFFWAYYDSSLAPTIEIGSVWPPVYLTPMDPFGFPLLNTLILLLSGCTVTRAHEYLIEGKSANVYVWLSITIYLALLFTSIQAIEYFEASFSLSDSIYGTTFYMATGFHGFHVLVGTFFLNICRLRCVNGTYTRDHHFGFEASAWYWHFVDVVWIFLFISIYWWGYI